MQQVVPAEADSAGNAGDRGAVLLVTRNLPPLRGGMERLIHGVYRELAKERTVHVVGPKGCGLFLSATSQIRSVASAPLPRFLVGAQWQALQAARRLRPSLILSGSGLTGPAASLAGRVAHCPVAGFLHGLDVVAAHPLYQALFLPAIRSWDHVLVNSRYTAELANAAGVDSSRIEILHPGVTLPDLPVPHVREFRIKHGLGSRPIVLSAGRLTERKGLTEFVRHCLPRIVRELPETVFVIVGDEARNAARVPASTTPTVLEAVAAHNLQNHVVLLGAVDDDALAQAYAASRVLVFPVVERPGDVEGFGIVAIEAAAHGIPTVAFRVGGVPDAVQDGASGTLIAPGDYVHLADVMIGYLKKEASEAERANCRTFAGQFSWEHFGRRLRSLCRAWADAGVSR